MDNEVGFNQPIVQVINSRNLTDTPQQIKHQFADGERYWRVRMEESAPVGDWSQIMHFSKTRQPVITNLWFLLLLMERVYPFFTLLHFHGLP